MNPGSPPSDPVPKPSAPPARRLTVIILTFNSEGSLQQVIDSVTPLSPRIVVVDSFSTDRTRDIATAAGCEVQQHAFEHYAAQRNWSQEAAGLADDDWVLHLDADEVASPEMRDSISAALGAPTSDGYLVQRLTYFLGHPIRHGYMNPSWHLRLYRAGKGRCEDRLYDQHFILDGPTSRLSGLLHDLQLISVERWTASHNRWSTAVALEYCSQRSAIAADTLEARLGGDPRMRKRWLKENLYGRAPLLARALAVFLYGYVLRFGFLDGRIGLIYHVLHAFWFRFLIDSKIIEHELEQRRAAEGKM
jgi:glycosyltransferase involved in cell wall biosynthesis